MGSLEKYHWGKWLLHNRGGFGFAFGRESSHSRQLAMSQFAVEDPDRSFWEEDSNDCCIPMLNTASFLFHVLNKGRRKDKGKNKEGRQKWMNAVKVKERMRREGGNEWMKEGSRKKGREWEERKEISKSPWNKMVWAWQDSETHGSRVWHIPLICCIPRMYCIYCSLSSSSRLWVCNICFAIF